MNSAYRTNWNPFLFRTNSTTVKKQKRGDNFRKCLMYRFKEEKHKYQPEVLMRAHEIKIYWANPLNRVSLNHHHKNHHHSKKSLNYWIIKFFWLTKLIINQTNVYTAFWIISIKECDHQMIGSLVLGLEQMWGLWLLGIWWLHEKQRFPLEIW